MPARGPVLGMMYKRAVVVILTSLLVVTLQSCGSHTSRFVPTRSDIKEIGLAAYPNARILRGSRQMRSFGLGRQEAVTVELITHDSFAQVFRYYQPRVPATARRMTIPLGIVSSTLFQWYDKNTLKQVAIVNVKTNEPSKVTVIELEAITYLVGVAPSQAPT